MTEPLDLPAYANPNHPGNGPEHRTKKKCIEPGCEERAGTAWGPYWCFKHNVERIRRIDAQLRSLVDGK
jgi:hypothetical protein